MDRVEIAPHLASSKPSRPASSLVARERELDVLRAFVAGLEDAGDSLLLSGEAGVGKSALLLATDEMAVAAGILVLHAQGVEFEAGVSYAGLNQLLLPLLDRLGELSPTHRAALSTALGFGDQPAPERLVVWSAVLDLLRRAAEGRPLLAMIDDVQWLDRPTALALGFVARRLATSRVGLIAATRPEDDGFFVRTGLRELVVRPLEPVAAAALLDAAFPDLEPSAHRSVVLEAEGNPLALMELPLGRSRERARPREDQPLSRRLRSLFASQVAKLPTRTRKVLLIAALEPTADLLLLRHASDEDPLASLAPAERARLVSVVTRERRVVFRHPLVRAAIVGLANGEERRAAHLALAGALSSDAERGAWHLAEGTVEPDEGVARALEAASYTFLRRGDPVGAIGLLTRAADLSAAGDLRDRRIAEAAYIGADVTGDLRDVGALLARVDAVASQDSSLPVAIAASYLLLNGDGDIGTAHRLLVGALERALETTPRDAAIISEAVYTLMLICFFGARAVLWRPYFDSIAKAGDDLEPTLRIASETFPDPARVPAQALIDLERLLAGLDDESDPTRVVRAGIAAIYVDRLAACGPALRRIVEDGRSGGAVASAINALVLLAYEDFVSGRWDEAAALATEAIEVCAEKGYVLLGWPARLIRGLIAAARGDSPTAGAIADELTRWATPRGVAKVEIYAHHIRSLDALGRGEFVAAFRHATAVSPAGVLAAQVGHALWVILDLVDAAMRTGKSAEAAAHAIAVSADDIARISPRMTLVAYGAQAIAEEDDARAYELFGQALVETPDDPLSFERARVRLAYGERLRRRRAMSAARAQLEAALETFERLGALPWSRRAEAEIRATGQRRQRGFPASESLTPQEREIALLAASGLSNREIAARVFLSHRTVGAHLYRVFPKLGISSRAALRDALTQDDEDRPAT